MSLGDLAHSLLAGDLILKVEPDTTGLDVKLAARLTAAERAAEASAARVTASTTRMTEASTLSSKKLEAAQLRQSAAQETYNRMLRAGAVDTVRLERAQAALLTTERSVAAEQSRLAASAALANRSRAQRVVESTLANVPGGATAGGLIARAEGSLGAGGLVRAGAVAGGALAAVELAKASAAQFEQEALAVRNIQRATDATAESSSKLHIIFERFSLDSDSASTALLRFGRNIDATPEKLTQFGVTIARDRQGRVDLAQTLINANDAFHRLPDGAAKADLALSLFGRGGKALLPVLQANRDTLREFIHEAEAKGLIFSQQDLTNATAYEQSVKSLQETWHGLEITIGRDVVPQLTRAINDVDLVVTKAESVGKHLHIGIGDVAKQLALGPFAPVTHLFHLFGGHDAASASEALDAAQAMADRSAAIAQQQQATDDAITAAQQSYAGGIDPFAAPSHVDRRHLDDAIASARDQAASAQRAITEAEQGLEHARRSDTTTAAQLTTAEDRLSNAKDRAAGASRRLSAAEDARTKALKAPGLDPVTVLKRARKTLEDQQSEAQAVAILQHRGATRAAIADLINLDKTAPGTIELAAKNTSKKYIRELNHTLSDVARTGGIIGEAFAKNTKDDHDIVARAKHDIDLYWQTATKEGRRLAGQLAGVQFGDEQGGGRGAAPAATPRSRYTTPVQIPGLNASVAGLPSTYNFNGPVTFTGPDDAKRAAQKAARQRRLQALGSGPGGI